MATRLSPADEAPFNIQIKNLADEELLDFWEETQQSRERLACRISANGGSCSGLRASYRAGAAVAFLPAPEVLRSLIIS